MKTMLLAVALVAIALASVPITQASHCDEKELDDEVKCTSHHLIDDAQYILQWTIDEVQSELPT